MYSSQPPQSVYDVLVHGRNEGNRSPTIVWTPLKPVLARQVSQIEPTPVSCHMLLGSRQLVCTWSVLFGSKYSGFGKNAFMFLGSSPMVAPGSHPGSPQNPYISRK